MNPNNINTGPLNPINTNISTNSNTENDFIKKYILPNKLPILGIVLVIFTILFILSHEEKEVEVDDDEEEYIEDEDIDEDIDIPSPSDNQNTVFKGYKSLDDLYDDAQGNDPLSQSLLTSSIRLSTEQNSCNFDVKYQGADRREVKCTSCLSEEQLSEPNLNEEIKSNDDFCKRYQYNSGDELSSFNDIFLDETYIQRRRGSKIKSSSSSSSSPSSPSSSPPSPPPCNSYDDEDDCPKNRCEFFVDECIDKVNNFDSDNKIEKCLAKSNSETECTEMENEGCVYRSYGNVKCNKNDEDENASQKNYCIYDPPSGKTAIWIALGFNILLFIFFLYSAIVNKNLFSNTMIYVLCGLLIVIHIILLIINLFRNNNYNIFNGLTNTWNIINTILYIVYVIGMGLSILFFNNIIFAIFSIISIYLIIMSIIEQDKNFNVLSEDWDDIIEDACSGIRIDELTSNKYYIRNQISTSPESDDDDSLPVSGDDSPRNDVND
tara:strand:+ start:1125 stop:2600 length:1476 start_codon:yes stop_codon:yes gene_type:complete